jgi:hypothetical protein
MAMSGRLRRLTTLLVAIAVGAAAFGVVFAARSIATAPENKPQIDFSSITPFVVDGLGNPTPDYPPDFSKFPGCTAPADEKLDPKLPPLSCRRAIAEPPDGAINTPSPDEIPTTPTPADGSKVIDNRAFRYLLTIPSDWYSNMRPEGGEFIAYDPITSEAASEQRSPPGGVWISFTSRLALTRPTVTD